MSADTSAAASAARASHILHERPTDAGLIADLLTAALARCSADAPGPQAVVVTADAEGAILVAEVARELATSIPVVPVTSVKRAVRLLADAPIVLAGALVDLLELQRRAVLKLEHVNQVVVLEAERLDGAGDLAQLDALLAELPKEGSRIVVAAEVTEGVRDLAERHLHRARRLSAPGGAATPPAAMQLLITAAATRGRALGHLLDDLDPPSVVVLTERASDRAAAEAALARVGVSAPLAQVLGTSDPIPEHAALLVCWGVPSVRRLAAAGAAQPARVIALVTARERLALASAATGVALTPYVLNDSARATRAADARLRAALRDALAKGVANRELLAIEPLFEQFDPSDVAAAAVRLFESARAELTAAREAAAVVAAQQAPRDAAPRHDAREERAPRPAGRSGPPARGGAARGADRGPRSGGDRSGPRSGGDRSGPRSGSDRGPRGSGPRSSGPRAGAPRSGSDRSDRSGPPARGAGRDRDARGGDRGPRGGMPGGPKGFGRGRPPRGPEEGGGRGEWQERGERLTHSKRRRDD
ncbi:MAG: hypothetical protein SFW08_11575 [Gemmatimonadaceae bacterium]|nr:hypothetical protein [Gemmatimonadaceae bacterium]